MDMLNAHLDERVKQRVRSARSVVIASTLATQSICNTFSKRAKRLTGGSLEVNATLKGLCRKILQAGTGTVGVFLPMHVHENHWITVRVDLTSDEISHGKHSV